MVVRRRLAQRRASTVVGICLVALACAGATIAGVPGRWETVVQGANVPGNGASDLGLARTPDGVLHVAWKERTGPSNEVLRVRSVSSSGRLGAVSTIAEGWASLSDPELVTESGGRLRVYFGGRKTPQSGEPLSGLLTATAPASGASWSAPSVIHDRNQVGAARNPVATVARDGTHYQTWYGVSEIYVHRGLDAALPNQLFSASPPLDETGSTIVGDAAGRVWVSWCGSGNGGGLFVQRADPGSGAAIGAARKLPGSTSPFQGKQITICNLERTAARRTPTVARVGGGVFIAGSAGYLKRSQVLVWRIDPSGQIPGGSFVVAEDAAFGHYATALAAAPDGRIWVAWLESRTGGVVAARRSNRLGTAWGEPVRVEVPGGRVLGALNIAAQGGRLDVLGLLDSSSAGKSVQHTQLLPGLTLKLTQATRRPDGKVALTFRVSDAGDPVAGARVVVGSVSAVTSGNGLATLVLGSPRPGALRATASRAGYVDHTIGFRCC